MAGKKTIARKTSSKKTTPAKEPSLKQNVVAMEQNLEKGAADLGRRAMKEMPALKAVIVKAANWLVDTAAAVTDDIKTFVVDLSRRLTGKKPAVAKIKPATKKATAARKKPAVARKPAARKRAAPGKKAGTTKRRPVRRKTTAKKKAAPHRKAV